MQVYFFNYSSVRRNKTDCLDVCKIKTILLVELPQATQSPQEPHQDETPEHLNTISTEDILTYLNDNEGIIDLDDGEGLLEEEMEFDSDSEKICSSQSDDPNSDNEIYIFIIFQINIII